MKTKEISLTKRGIFEISGILLVGAAISVLLGKLWVPLGIGFFMALIGTFCYGFFQIKKQIKEFKRAQAAFLSGNSDPNAKTIQLSMDEYYRLMTDGGVMHDGKPIVLEEIDFNDDKHGKGRRKGS